MTIAQSPIDLTVTAAVVAYMGGNAPPQAALDQIQTLITNISSWVAQFCSRNFNLQSYTEYRNGRGTRQMFTLQRPIASVSVVQIGPTVVPPIIAGPAVDTGGYKYDDKSIYVFSPYCFDAGNQNILFTYTAGWQTPGMGGPVTLPQSLQQAVIEAVADRYKRRDYIGVASRSIAGEAITYIQKDLPTSAASVINSFKRVDIPLQ